MDASLAPRELTPTEQAIVEYIGRGMVDAEIAVRLGLTTSDLKYRITRLLQDFRLMERADLAGFDPDRPLPALTANDRAVPRTRRAAAVLGSLALVAAGLVGVVALVATDRENDSAYDPELAAAVLADPRIKLLYPPESFLPTIDALDEMVHRTGAYDPGNVIHYGDDIELGGSLTVVGVTTDEHGQPAGIHRIGDTGITPIFLPPEGGIFRSGASDMAGERLAVVYTHNAARWLTWSFDGGETWSEPYRMMNYEIAVGVLSTGVLLASENSAAALDVGYVRTLVSFDRERTELDPPPTPQVRLVGELSPGNLIWTNGEQEVIDEDGDLVLDLGPDLPDDALITAVISRIDGKGPRLVAARSLAPSLDHLVVIENDGKAGRTWTGAVGQPLATDGRYVITKDCLEWSPLDCTLVLFDPVIGMAREIVLPYNAQFGILAVAPTSE